MRINWYIAWFANFDAHFGQKVNGKFIGIGQVENFAIELKLDANVEVFKAEKAGFIGRG